MLYYLFRHSGYVVLMRVQGDTPFRERMKRSYDSGGPVEIEAAGTPDLCSAVAQPAPLCSQGERELSGGFR